MSSEAELIIRVWETVRDSVSHSKRGEIAKDLLYAFCEFGFEAADIASITDEDTDLEEAFLEVYPPLETDENDDEY